MTVAKPGKWQFKLMGIKKQTDLNLKRNLIGNDINKQRF